jgi:hypothetical protein
MIPTPTGPLSGTAKLAAQSGESTRIRPPSPSGWYSYSWFPVAGMLGTIPFSQPPASNHSPHSSSWFSSRWFTRSPAWIMKRAVGMSEYAVRIARDHSERTAFCASPK